MNVAERLFTNKEHMIFEGITAKIKAAALLVPLQILLLGLSVFLLAGIAFIDWEIYFRVFEYLAGEDGYWSPHLMAFTGIVMIIGFHLLAEKHPDHFIVRLINNLSSLIIAAFVIGGGLYLASILYADGMGDLNAHAPLIAIGEAVDSDGNWIDALFAQVTSPGAVLALSLGIGGLSIVSLSIAHGLISLIRQHLSEIYTRSAILRAALRDHGIIQRSEVRHSELQTREQDLVFHDEDHFRLELADEALEVIADHLIPHEQVLQEREFNTPQHRWEKDYGDETKRISAAVKKIRAITAEDIFKSMNPPKQLRRSS